MAIRSKFTENHRQPGNVVPAQDKPDSFRRRKANDAEKRMAKCDALSEKALNAHGIAPETAFSFSDIEKCAKGLRAFIDEAGKKGFTSKEINATLDSFEHIHELLSPVNVPGDQTSNDVKLGGTQKLDWYLMTQGAKAVVEKTHHGPTQLNGDFRKCHATHSSSEYDTKEELADSIYMVKHALGHDLPFPFSYWFVEKARTSSEVGPASKKAASHREQFKLAAMGRTGTVVGDYIHISDNFHPKQPDGKIKMRMICLVFNMEEGKLLVVTDKKTADGESRRPQEYSKWVRERSTLHDIMSCNDKTLTEIQVHAEKLGLVGKLLNPPASPEEIARYSPWAETVDYAKRIRVESTGKEKGYYTLANQIWAYASLMRQADCIDRFQRAWPDLKVISETREQGVCDVDCDDGRVTSGRLKPEVKCFASLFSHGEHRQVSSREFSWLRIRIHGLEELCGFDNAAIYYHLDFKAIGKRLSEGLSHEEDQGFSEYKRSMDFFAAMMEAILLKEGPMTDYQTMRSFLPPDLAKALKEVDRKRLRQPGASRHAVSDLETERLAIFMHNVFIGNSEDSRTIIRRAFANRVFETGEDGLPLMPDAMRTMDRINSAFSPEEQVSFGLVADGKPTKYTKYLITEEVARSYMKRLDQWNAELPLEQRKTISIVTTNFRTRQVTMLPMVPNDLDKEGMRAFLICLVRHEAMLNDPLLFSKEKIKKYGLEKFMTFELSRIAQGGSHGRQ